MRRTPDGEKTIPAARWARDVRARAKALAAEAAHAVRPGGSSYADLELLVQEIRKLASSLQVQD